MLVCCHNNEDGYSLHFSDQATSGPQIATNRTPNENFTLAASVAHHGGEFIFAGHENGAVVAYSSKTELPI